jgi:integrase
MEGVRVNELVFPSPRSKMFSDMAMLVLLKRMSSGDRKWVEPSTGKPIVPHGFRSSFRTWAEECATFPHAIVEEAMGHVVGTAVERAYRRTDVLEQRRALMTAWQNYCEPKAGANVLAFTKSGGKTA